MSLFPVCTMLLVAFHHFLYLLGIELDLLSVHEERHGSTHASEHHQAGPELGGRVAVTRLELKARSDCDLLVL